MIVASRSDVGKVRTNNEDSILIDSERGIFILADGMGGHNAGEVASKITVEAVHAFLQDKIREIEGDEELLSILDAAVIKAHGAIREKALADMNLRGMGTTIVVLVIKDGMAYLCHAGDSRAYLWRDNLKRLTKDHTVGDSWVEKGYMPREQVPPQQWHTLTQCVGIGDNPAPDKTTVELKPGDILLLCSDGLTNMLTDDEIAEILRKMSFPHAGNPSEERLRLVRSDEAGASSNILINKMADTLVAAANKKGGKDNISLILINEEIGGSL